MKVKTRTTKRSKRKAQLRVKTALQVGHSNYFECMQECAADGNPYWACSHSCGHEYND